MIDRLAELLGVSEREDEDEREKDEDVVDAGPLTGPGRLKAAPDPEKPENTGGAAIRLALRRNRRSLFRRE